MWLFRQRLARWIPDFVFSLTWFFPQGELTPAAARGQAVVHGAMKKFKNRKCSGRKIV